MPLFRYFAVVGSLLVAMLFLANKYLTPAASIMRNAGEVDKSVIRIISAHNWPDRIVFDTNVPIPVPLEPTVSPPAPVETPARDALAELTKPIPKVGLVNTPPVGTQRKVRRRLRSTRMATYRPAPRRGGFDFDWNW